MDEDEYSPEELKALEVIEKGIADFLNAQRGESTLVTGWVLQAKAQAASTMHNHQTIGIWMCPDIQDNYTTLGLVDALRINVQDHFKEATHEEGV